MATLVAHCEVHMQDVVVLGDSLSVYDGGLVTGTAEEVHGAFHKLMTTA